MSSDNTPIKRVRFAPTDYLSVNRKDQPVQPMIDNITRIHNIYRTQSITISVDYRFTPLPKRCTGSNSMYSQRKGNTFVLFDCSPDSTTWFIVTNNHRFQNIPSYTFECKKNPNLKFRISKCLTYFFHIQKAVPYRESSRKFFAIRRLLIEKHLALMNRITSRNKNY